MGYDILVSFWCMLYTWTSFFLRIWSCVLYMPVWYTHRFTVHKSTACWCQHLAVVVGVGGGWASQIRQPRKQLQGYANISTLSSKSAYENKQFLPFANQTRPSLTQLYPWGQEKVWAHFLIISLQWMHLHWHHQWSQHHLKYWEWNPISHILRIFKEVYPRNSIIFLDGVNDLDLRTLDPH